MGLRKTTLLLFISLLILLTSCNSRLLPGGCPDAEIEWVDVLMLNDIKYEHHFPEPGEPEPISIVKGAELGKVAYKMAGHACTKHQTQNGDAAYLEIGTPVYEVKGYPAALIVLADDKVYVANTNNKANKAGELLPLKGFLKNIYLESTNDGSRIHTFSQASKENFIESWYNLNIEDVNGLIKKGRLDGQSVFLELELNNEVSFRLLYWADTNTFHNGVIGNDEIKNIIERESSTLTH